jgi:biopolymer transport protein ExbB/TolQ
MNRTRATLRVDRLSYSPTMILKPFFLFLALVAMVQLAPFAFAQEVDGSDLRREVREREERVNKLSIEEQVKLRAAERNAAEDPAVKAALEKRNRAIQEFRAALRASIIKSDPTVEPILDKVAIGVRRGP